MDICPGPRGPRVPSYATDLIMDFLGSYGKVMAGSGIFLIFLNVVMAPTLLFICPERIISCVRSMLSLHLF